MFKVRLISSIFSKITIDTVVKFSGYTKLLTGYPMIYHTSSSHSGKILQKFLHCSVHSGVILFLWLLFLSLTLLLLLLLFFFVNIINKFVVSVF